MEFFNSYLIPYWAMEFLAAFFWVLGLVTFVIGACLLIGRREPLLYFEAANRRMTSLWAFRPLTVIPDSHNIEQRHLRWIALAFITGGSYALYGLIPGFDGRALMHFFAVNERFFPMAFWFAESARWALIAGNLCAIVAGLMLGVFPGTFAYLEARGNSRFSVRRPVDGVNKKPFTLDNWVAEFPQTAGWVLSVAGLVPMGDFGVMLYGIR